MHAPLDDLGEARLVLGIALLVPLRRRTRVVVHPVVLAAARPDAAVLFAQGEGRHAAPLGAQEGLDADR